MKKKILTQEIVKQQGWNKLEVITADMLDGYTVIGNWAFCGCHNLTSIIIPNSVTSIRGAAFYGCTDLASVTIPNSVTYIGEYTFFDCTSLTSVNIPNSVTRIRNYTFYGCSSLTSVIIPNSVISIGDSVFEGCSRLKSVTIPDGVIQIELRNFYGCGLKVEKRYDEQGRLIAYKGFNSNMTCRGFQYEEGKTYKVKGKIELCKRGFHACTNPLDCFNYYWGRIGKDVVFHEVYLEDVSDETGDDSKVVAKKITIGREITPSEMAENASGKK